MFSTILPLISLLISSTLAAYPPAYLAATCVYGNPCTDCGMLGALTTSAGKNVAILTNDTSKALTGQFNNTYWTFNGFSKTYSLTMSPTANSKQFPHYGNVNIDAGLTTAGFGEGDEDGLLVWNNTDMANVGSWFAFCPRVIPGHEAAGVQDQVFWQSNEAPEKGIKGCNTIVIHGAYE